MSFGEKADAMAFYYYSSSEESKLQALSEGISLMVYIKRNDVADLRENLK